MDPSGRGKGVKMENIANQSVQAESSAKYLKRFLAFIIDSIFLGLIGISLGFLFTRTFILMGWHGRFVGFTITLIYFTVFNSHLLNGQTIGQKILKIKIVDNHGNSLSLLKSTIRSLFLPTLALLNNWTLPIDPNSIVLQIIGFVLFSLLLSEVYFLCFSGKSKQLLHDVITNTYVVDADTRCSDFQHVSNTVFFYSFTPMVLVIIIMLIVKLISSQENITDLVKMQSDIQTKYKIHHVSIYKGTTTFTGNDKTTNTTSYLRVSCIKDNQFVDNDILTKEIFSVLKTYSISQEVDVIELYYVTGYDIGIASNWKNTSKKYSKAEYLELIK